MYRKIEPPIHMTANDASIQYPNDFILMQLDDNSIYDPAGLILYIGDDFDELFSMQVNLPVSLGVVVEGLNHQRSLGGIVVGT